MNIFGIVLLVVSGFCARSKVRREEFTSGEGHIIDPAVTRLSSENFERLTGITLPFTKENNQKPFANDWFVALYSPNCPHCKKALPEWN